MRGDSRKRRASDRSSAGLRLPAYRRMPGNAADSTGPTELASVVAGESWDFRVVVPVGHNFGNGLTCRSKFGA